MSKRLHTILLLMLLPLLLTSCSEQKKSEQPPAKPVAVGKKTMTPLPLLKVSIAAQVIETTGDALPLWRTYGGSRPTLLFFSNKTLLPVPVAIKTAAAGLLAANEAELVRRTARPDPERLLHPSMAVGAALQSGYFGRVIWVVPVAVGRQLERDGFVKQLQEKSPGWGKDLQSFVAQEQGLRGTLAGIPIDVVTIDQLPQVSAPVLVHIDTGYFQPLYQGEIKTPLYVLLRSHLRLLASKNYQSGPVTVSRDNLFDELPLSTRFLAQEIANFFIDPTKIEKSNPNEALRIEALYLENFMQNEKIVSNYEKLQQSLPGDASVHYGGYQALRNVQQGNESLAALQRAVALDPGYAYEYLNLVGIALEKDRPEKALQMFDLAIAAQPDNFIILLQKADLLLGLGKKEEAIVLLEKLINLPWSEYTYPQMRQKIRKMLDVAQHP